MKGSQKGSVFILLFYVFTDFRLKGLIGHLESHFPAMNRLYLELKSRPNKPSTLQELQLAANVIPLDSKIATDYIQALEAKMGPLIEAFKRAAEKAEVSNILFSLIAILLTMI